MSHVYTSSGDDAFSSPKDDPVAITSSHHGYEPGDIIAITRGPEPKQNTCALKVAPLYFLLFCVLVFNDAEAWRVLIVYGASVYFAWRGRPQPSVRGVYRVTAVSETTFTVKPWPQN